MSRRAKTDFAKIMAEAAKLLEKHGADTSEITPVDGPGVNYRSEDAIVIFANHPPHFKPGKCKNCDKTFAVNKKSVGFCSNECRKEEWRRKMGIPWAAVSTHDVWEGDPPLIITPEQLQTLENVTRWFIRNQKSLEIDLPAIELPPERPVEIPKSPEKAPVLPHNLAEDDDFDLFESLEQTDQIETSPHTNHSGQQSPEVQTQNFEEEPVFDFD